MGLTNSPNLSARDGAAVLPAFSQPPIVEVAASIQFSTLRGLDAARLGALWLRFRGRYPRTEQHPALPPVVEAFGGVSAPKFGFSLSASLPAPRLWFLNSSGTRLVQVQSDRLVVNWRQLDTDSEYPRYDSIRADLVDAIAELSRFLTDEDVGHISVEQAELTYVNHLKAGVRGKPRLPLSHFLSIASEVQSELLPSPEEMALRVQFVMPKEGHSQGRLYLEVDPAYTSSGNAPIYVMNLIARGTPASKAVEDALGFLDSAHTWIVRGFAELTTPQAQAEWGRSA